MLLSDVFIFTGIPQSQHRTVVALAAVGWSLLCVAVVVCVIQAVYIRYALNVKQH